MKFNIMTSFNENYWKDIAQVSSELLDKNWPSEFEIIIYHQLPGTVKTNFSSRVIMLDLYSTCPELPKFGEQWKDHPNANGTNNKYRSNAVKFVHKTFAIWHQRKLMKEGWLIWIDCDAILQQPMTETFLKEICLENTVVSYVGRPGRFSECGFLAFNMANPLTHQFLQEWEDLYVSGKFIDLPETHDSWTFDYIRKKWNKPELFNNLNAEAITDKNPFSQSKIGKHFVHHKGKDKAQQLTRNKKRVGI